MVPRKFHFALTEILDEIAWMEEVTSSTTFAAFATDRTLRYAVERSIEIVSEASRRIPDDLKALQPQIPWRAIADIGNVMRHAYHTTSPTIVWNAVRNDLPKLKTAILAIQAIAPPEEP